MSSPPPTSNFQLGVNLLSMDGDGDEKKQTRFPEAVGPDNQLSVEDITMDPALLEPVCSVASVARATSRAVC